LRLEQLLLSVPFCPIHMSDDLIGMAVAAALASREASRAAESKLGVHMDAELIAHHQRDLKALAERQWKGMQRKGARHPDYRDFDERVESDFMNLDGDDTHVAFIPPPDYARYAYHPSPHATRAPSLLLARSSSARSLPLLACIDSSPHLRCVVCGVCGVVVCSSSPPADTSAATTTERCVCCKKSFPLKDLHDVVVVAGWNPLHYGANTYKFDGVSYFMRYDFAGVRPSDLNLGLFCSPCERKGSDMAILSILQHMKPRTIKPGRCRGHARVRAASGAAVAASKFCPTSFVARDYRARRVGRTRR